MYVLCYVLCTCCCSDCYTCSEYHCSVNCSRPATLNNCPHAAVLQGYAVTYCGAQCVPDSECLCMMSIFEEDILIQTDSSNCAGVSHLTRPPPHQAVIPDKAAHTDLFVLKCRVSIKDCQPHKEPNQEPLKIPVSILENLDKTIVPLEIIPRKIKMLIGNRFNELLEE